MKRPLVIAIDFDGTLFRSAWPDIGKPKRIAIWITRQLRRCGCRIVLWTGRMGRHLDHALIACRTMKVYLDGVNETIIRLPDGVEESRKICCDLYIDDRSVTMPTVRLALLLMKVLVRGSMIDDRFV